MNIKRDGLTPNAGRLLWAGFMAILAAGVGFGIRGAIFTDWVKAFNFTGLETGLILTAPDSPASALASSSVASSAIRWAMENWSPPPFLFHVISALVVLAPSTAWPQDRLCLPVGRHVPLSPSPRTLEAVANPLVATLFPNNRTHYLNILHASWPAGMVMAVSSIPLSLPIAGRFSSPLLPDSVGGVWAHVPGAAFPEIQPHQGPQAG
jgi:hypothetical protein